MNENDYINNNNTFNLKTNPVMDANGQVIEPSVYVDSNMQMNKIGDDSEFTKEQLEEMKSKINLGIEKTSKQLTFDELTDTYVHNSSNAVRTQALQEIQKRVISGEIVSTVPEWSKEEYFSHLSSWLDEQRREYLRAVATSKGNVR